MLLITLSEIEEKKKYSILARAIMMSLEDIDIECHVDIKSEDDKLKVCVENK